MCQANYVDTHKINYAMDLHYICNHVTLSLSVQKVSFTFKVGFKFK